MDEQYSESQTARLEREVARLSGELDFYKSQLSRVSGELGEGRWALAAIYLSWSWRLTAPLRTGVDIISSVRGFFSLRGLSLANPAGILALGQWLWFRKQIQEAGLFDTQYYLRENPRVAEMKISALLHFFVFGAAAGLNPHFLFDVSYYRQSNPDVARSRTNPLVHYLKWGGYEGRDPHPEFDSSFYLEQNADVRKRRLNPLAHYLAPGIVEGRNPNHWFKTADYFERHPHVALAALNPLEHYLKHRSYVLGHHTHL